MFAGSWYVLGFYNFAPRDHSSSMLPVQWSRNSWWISTHEWIWKSHIQAIEWQRRCCLLQVPCEGTVSELDVVLSVESKPCITAISVQLCSVLVSLLLLATSVRSCCSGTCSLFTDPLFSLFRDCRVCVWKCLLILHAYRFSNRDQLFQPKLWKVLARKCTAVLVLKCTWAFHW